MKDNKMDGTEDSPYLNLLNNGSSNYLLQSNEEMLGVQDPTLNVEPMFTEIEDGTGAWSVNLPLLMNGNLIPEADNELESSINLPPVENAIENNIDLPSSLVALYNEQIGNQSNPLQAESISNQQQLTYPIEYNTESTAATDRIFITNDLLLELNLGGETAENGSLNLNNGVGGESTLGVVNQPLAQIPEPEELLINPQELVPQNNHPLQQMEPSDYNINGASDEIISHPQLFNNESDITPESEEIFKTSNINTSDDMIRILNMDGAIVNINKELFNNLSLSKEQTSDLENDTEIVNNQEQENLEDCYEAVMAYKCKKCLFLYEQYEDIIEHCRTGHPLFEEEIIEQNGIGNSENGLLNESESPLETTDNNVIKECNRKPANWKKLVLQPKLQKLHAQERVHSVIEHWKPLQVPTEKSKSENEKTASTLLINKIQEQSQKNEVIKDQDGNEVKLKSILKNDNQMMVYICSECNLGFGNMEKLRHHMILVHRLVQKPNQLETKDDNKLTDETKNSGKKPNLTVALIQRQARASKKIKCSIKGCELRFAMDEMRIRHEKCHVDGQKKQFKCFECDAKFSIWRICSMHLWKCHKLDLGLYTCPMCSVVKASTPFRLLTHMAIHEEEKPFLCSICGKSFKQHSQLRNHQIIHKEFHEVPDWATQQQCEICKKYFANSKCLKKHIQCVHDKFKPFMCNICGHKTGRKSMLNLHLRQHTGEKPHRCPVCEFRTGDHNSLRRHMMRHSGNTKYSCPHCDYQSIQSTSYKNHIANKHPGLGGSYFCSLCSYHTVNENAYICHIADHKNGLIKETNGHKDDENMNEEIYNNLIAITGENPELNENDESRKLKLIGDTEDDETHMYLSSMMDHSNDAVDTGGITIPAGLELQVPL